MACQGVKIKSGKRGIPIQEEVDLDGELVSSSLPIQIPPRVTVLLRPQLRLVTQNGSPHRALEATADWAGVERNVGSLGSHLRIKTLQVAPTFFGSVGATTIPAN